MPTVSDIYPLHPFRSIQDFKDSAGNFYSRAIVDYYVVYGNVNDTSYLSDLLIDFAAHHADSSIMKQPFYYEFRFYKKSSKTNKDFKESNFDLIDYHTDDYIANVTLFENGNRLLFVQH